MEQLLAKIAAEQVIAVSILEVGMGMGMEFELRMGNGVDLGCFELWSVVRQHSSATVCVSSSQKAPHCLNPVETSWKDCFRETPVNGFHLKTSLAIPSWTQVAVLPTAA